MKKQFFTAMALSAAVLSISACSWMEGQSDKTMPPGHYESSNSSVNAAGTRTDTSKDTDVYYDANGDKRSKVTTSTTKDPKGLFNKSTSTSTKTY